MKKSTSFLALIAIFLALVATSLFFAPGPVHADVGWTTDYNKALAQAKAEKKMVLLNFTGSDWCEWCILLDKEVFSTAKFQDYAKKNLILVTVDFPQAKEQPLNVKKQNEDLRDKFDVQVFPSVMVLNPDGKKVGQLGYQPGGPDEFLSQLAKVPRG